VLTYWNTYISYTGADELISRGLGDEAILLFADGSGDKAALWSRRRGAGDRIGGMNPCPK